MSSTACSIPRLSSGAPEKASKPAAGSDSSAGAATTRRRWTPPAHFRGRAALPDRRRPAHRHHRRDEAAAGLFRSRRSHPSAYMLQAACRRNSRRSHGTIAGARFCVVGLGRLGTREMTCGHRSRPDPALRPRARRRAFDGPKPLAASQYFARLTQRLIAAHSAPTAEGVLYELDFRLRPSGNRVRSPPVRRLRALSGAARHGPGSTRPWRGPAPWPATRSADKARRTRAIPALPRDVGKLKDRQRSQMRHRSTEGETRHRSIGSEACRWRADGH